MPKKKKELDQEEQSKRFRKTVEDLVDAGELNPTEADERFEGAMRQIAEPRLYMRYAAYGDDRDDALL